jgi:positive regulator of sigma E activity
MQWSILGNGCWLRILFKKEIFMEHTLVFLLPLAGILIGAKIAGQLSHRIGVPAVFGELMLGLILQALQYWD